MTVCAWRLFEDAIEFLKQIIDAFMTDDKPEREEDEEEYEGKEKFEDNLTPEELEVINYVINLKQKVASELEQITNDKDFDYEKIPEDLKFDLDLLQAKKHT